MGEGGAIPFGLIASATTPFVGEIAKPLLKKILVGEEGGEGETKYTAKTTWGNTEIRSPNEQSFLERYERVSRRNLPSNITIRQTRTIGPRKRWVRRAPEQQI